MEQKFEVKLKQELEIWAARVFQRILTRFPALDISPFRKRREKDSPHKKKRFTGDLYRTMYWEVYKAAGRNKAKVQFFYLKYGNYVRWGVGEQFGGVKQTLWKIPPVGGKDITPIQSPGNSKQFAKPFIRREVKYHARWLLKRLAEQYSYYGNLYIIKGLSEGVGDPNILKKWIAENKDMLSKGILDWSDFK